jgi:hypothetical protein
LALEKLGPNGENWIQGTENVMRHGDKFCAWTAIYNAHNPPVFSSLSQEEHSRYLGLFGFESHPALYRWNDAPERTFSEVKAAFERAIELAKAAEGGAA